MISKLFSVCDIWFHVVVLLVFVFNVFVVVFGVIFILFAILIVVC